MRRPDHGCARDDSRLGVRRGRSRRGHEDSVERLAQLRQVHTSHAGDLAVSTGSVHAKGARPDAARSASMCCRSSTTCTPDGSHARNQRVVGEGDCPRPRGHRQQDRRRVYAVAGILRDERQPCFANPRARSGAPPPRRRAAGHRPGCPAAARQIREPPERDSPRRRTPANRPRRPGVQRGPRRRGGVPDGAVTRVVDQTAGAWRSARAAARAARTQGMSPTDPNGGRRRRESGSPVPRAVARAIEQQVDLPVRGDVHVQRHVSPQAEGDRPQVVGRPGSG